MDADEFLKRVEPAAKRSRLAPFLDDIKKLRGEGCTLDQVREFLAANGVTISVAGLSKFLKRQEEKPGAGQAATSAASGSAAGAAMDCAIQSQPAQPPHQGDQAEPEELASLDKKQRREKLADRFINSETQNPLLKRMKKEQEK